MTQEELIVEIEKVKVEIILADVGSPRVGELTVALVVLYETYIHQDKYRAAA